MVAKKTAPKGAPDPKSAAREAIAFMKGHSSQERVDTLQKYFKDPIQAYGVDYPAYKAWMKDFVKGVTASHA